MRGCGYEGVNDCLINIINRDEICYETQYIIIMQVGNDMMLHPLVIVRPTVYARGGVYILRYEAINGYGTHVTNRGHITYIYMRIHTPIHTRRFTETGS